MSRLLAKQAFAHYDESFGIVYKPAPNQPPPCHKPDITEPLTHNLVFINTMKMTLSRLPALLLATVLLTGNIALAEPLKPERAHQVTTLEVVRKLETRHLSKRSIDDALSRELLFNYLDALDNGRQIFLQEDIEQFRKKYADSLDDSLKSGNPQPGFDIFNRYRERNSKHLEKFIADMPATIKGFDFNSDETILADRTEAPWPKNNKEADAIWKKRLKASALSLKLAGKEMDGIIELLQKRYQNQLDRLNKIRSDDVYQIYMNALTELYDPHTNYMSPASSENFDISMSLKLEGIGAMLRMEDEYTRVVRLIHAGPADKQGELQPMDKIVGVAQGQEEMVDVVGWRLDEVVDLIRGPKGSTVRLEVIPAKAIGDDKRREITIVRDEVKLEEQSVQKAMLDVKDQNGVTRKIGILDIPTFYIDFEALRQRDPNYKSTTRDAARLLSDLINDGAEGIVIDLRGNGGGSLREANQLTGLFIEKGPSVQIRHADNRTYTESKDHYSPYYDGPVVILIDRMSASASEIFAGAMQDYERAVIVGSASFGKGTVQSLSPLSHGKLKITESRFYRISGEGTQSRGVVPDISLPDLIDETLVGESALDKALKWDAISPVSHKDYNNLEPIIKELKTLSQQRTDNNPELLYIRKTAEYEQSLDSDTISLNEKKRLKEREADQQKRLTLLNEKRKAQGKPLLESLEDQNPENPDEESEENKAADSEAGINKIDMEDPYLLEAAQILIDLDTQLNQLKIADDKAAAVGE